MKNIGYKYIYTTELLNISLSELNNYIYHVELRGILTR